LAARKKVSPTEFFIERLKKWICYNKVMGQIIKFPENFLWGSATSAYQVEGGIENNDWTEIYPAGRACDQYHLYEKDCELIQELNQNSHRFSLEWSRVEPEEGRFDEKEINHYRDVLQVLKLRGIETMVTLHHFTLPIWLAEKGGFANKKSIFYFSRFAEKVFVEYKDLVDFWITINEPLIYAFWAFPLLKKTSIKRLLLIASSFKVIHNQIASHKKIYEIFHRNSNNAAKVGIAKNNTYFEPFNNKSLLDKIGVEACRFFWNRYFLNRIKNHLDFIGLNYYFHRKVRFPFSTENENKAVSDIGWEIFPEGIYHTLTELQRYQLPIYVTENGLADAEDRLRKDFTRDHLFWIHRAIGEGVDVRGYFYWSFIDNFEWEKGFGPRFGLIAVDYGNMDRKIRPSGYDYAEICKDNGFIFD